MRIVSLVAAVFCVLLAPMGADAQEREYVTHLTYTPPNGEDPQAVFARAYPGMPVADRPGLTWQHDGHGWYHEATLDPLPGAAPDACPKPFNPYGMPDDVLARCLPKPPLRNPWTGEPFSYQIGEVYRDPYGARAIVLSIVSDIGSARRIITVRIMSSNDPKEVGALQAAYEDRARWMPLRPDEVK